MMAPKGFSPNKQNDSGYPEVNGHNGYHQDEDAAQYARSRQAPANNLQGNTGPGVGGGYPSNRGVG